MSKDTIYRQDAIDAADRADYTGLAVEDVKKVTDKVVKELKQLPPAQPEVTEEAVKEYCRKRCLCIVDSALLKKYASAQPEEVIPVAWLEEQAKWFESMDNAFAKIEANNIRVMIKKWRMKKDERSDFKSGGD